MQPKIYTYPEHGIAPEQIDPHAAQVIEKLKSAGHSAYLVGGGVRDLLLKRRPKDFDISTSAKPEEVRALFRNAILIGRRFRLAHVRFGSKIIEVSTFRAGDPETADLIVRDNEWGSAEEDVLRRDFTINGLFYDPHEGTVIDYVEGFSDLEKRTLRTIGQPEARFAQDPVRMLRLVKFCARFGFSIDPPTHSALLQCRHEIVKSSPARILEELLRMLESGAAAPFFRLMHDYGLLAPLLPELASFLGRDEYGLSFRLLEALDAKCAKEQSAPGDRALLLATLLLPLFHERLSLHVNETGRLPHLGEIGVAADRAIGQVFHPFFKLPRRLRAVGGAILTTQYRFIPLDGTLPERIRAPRESSLPLALELFELRCALEPELIPYYTQWTEAAFRARQAGEIPSEEEDHPPRRRRRRRRRR
jgi:poly(A) polymerase